MKETDRAWIAGIIDAMGTFSIQKPGKSKKRASLKLVINLTRRPILAREVGALLGRAPSGKVQEYNQYLRRPCTEHCPEPHQHVLSRTIQVVRINISNSNLANLMNEIEPYLYRWDEYTEAVNEVNELNRNIVYEEAPKEVAAA